MTVLASGTCTIAANQSGDATYTSDPEKTKNITVKGQKKKNQAIAAISFDPIKLVVGGTATVSATATSWLPVSFSSTTPSVCTVNDNTVTGLTAGVCTVAANQTGDIT